MNVAAPVGGQEPRRRPRTVSAVKRGRRPRQIDAAVILTAAAALFDRHGYTATTMQDVAAALGISKPTLYNFYPAKTDLLNGVFDFIIRGADRVLGEAEAASPEAALRVFVAGSLAFGAANRSLMNVFMSDERSLPASLRQRHNRWSRTAYRRLLALVEAADPVAEVDPRIVTFAVTAFINQVGTWFSQRGDLALDDIADSFCSMIGRGVLATKEHE